MCVVINLCRKTGANFVKNLSLSALVVIQVLLNPLTGCAICGIAFYNVLHSCFNIKGKRV